MYLCNTPCSYEEALQALADSEAKRETVDKELRLVSLIHVNDKQKEYVKCILAIYSYWPSIPCPTLYIIQQHISYVYIFQWGSFICLLLLMADVVYSLIHECSGYLFSSWAQTGNHALTGTAKLVIGIS